MDWFTGLLPTLSGLPWYAAAGIIVLSILATKCVDGVLKLWRFGFDREQYFNALEQKEHDALVDELKDRIDEMAKEIAEIKRESRDERMTYGKLLAEEKAAHSKCQIEQEQLRGDLRVQAEKLNLMQVQIDRLMSHEKTNAEHARKLAAIVKEETGKAPELT